ncbi:hypothetical protein [Caulobacter sp.]|uniref:hypothetical protein n=1 Tax=Caulobacter sp. TaxID=78 RepID=UPI003BAABF98
MTDGSVAIGATVRAGLSGLLPSLRACWAALAVAVLISAISRLLPPAAGGLTLLVEIAAAVLASGALYRRAFGRQSGLAGLRWGMDEWRLLGAQLLIAALMLVVLAVLATVVGAIALGVARASAPGFDATSAQAWRDAFARSGLGGIVAGAAPLFSLCLLVWLCLRLSLSAPASVDQARVRVLSAFPLTRGVTPQLLGAGLVLALPVVALAGVSSLIGRWAGPGLDAPLALLGAILLYLYLAPVWTGALVHVYRHRWTPDGTPG